MKKIIILVLITAIIFTLLFAAISSIKKQPTPESVPIPQMSPQPTQSSTPFPSITPVQPSSLKIVSLDPPVDKLNNISTATNIIITFNQIIDTTTFKYTSNPPLEIVTDFVADNVVFIPKIAWPTDTKLTITILYAKGDKGGILNSPYQIEFISPAPTGM